MCVLSLPKPTCLPSITDSVDTKRTCDLLKDLVKACNIYVPEAQTRSRPNRILLQNIGAFILKIFRVGDINRVIVVLVSTVTFLVTLVNIYTSLKS